jgi:hypothetical protein
VGDKRFWDLIAAGRLREHGPWRFEELLLRQLGRLAPGELAWFDWQFAGLLDAVYTCELVAAAELLHPGLSEEGFQRFRCWLVCMGKRVYEASLAAPDSLADVPAPADLPHPGVAHLGLRTWGLRGLPVRDYHTEYAQLGPAAPAVRAGTPWPIDDPAEVRQRLPRLWRNTCVSEG